MEPLVLAVVDDRALGEVCAREWRAETGGSLELRHIQASDLSTESKAYDVLILPQRLLGDAVALALADPLPPQRLKDANRNGDDILLRDASEFVKWENRVVAVSFGSPFLALLYRPDVLQAANIRVPTTWAEYLGAVELLAKNEALPKNEALSSTAQPLRVLEPLTVGWAAVTFLAHAAPYVRDISQAAPLFATDDFRPRISDPPFERALTELVRCARQSGHADQWLSTSPGEAAQAVLQGETFLALTWPHAAWTPTGSTNAVENNALAIAPLPGSKDYYSTRSEAWEHREDGQNSRVPLLGIAGQLGVVSSGSKHKRAASQFLFWLTSPDRGSSIATSSPLTFPFRKSHIQEITPWLGTFAQGSLPSQFSDLVEQTQREELWLTYPRFSYASRYMEVLDAAVRQAVAGEREVAILLRGVSEQWQRITDELGRESQRRSYLQSIGLGDLSR